MSDHDDGSERSDLDDHSGGSDHDDGSERSDPGDHSGGSDPTGTDDRGAEDVEVLVLRRRTHGIPVEEYAAAWGPGRTWRIGWPDGRSAREGGVIPFGLVPENGDPRSGGAGERPPNH
ncbi:hypothetical protein BRD00_04690 [Halobacteriales archaeon QS_8_69_26]|nr:MAG: hypothetical protein BRD00_04690 [Halobacteriales archaeon QS_8_69_26]